MAAWACAWVWAAVRCWCWAAVSGAAHGLRPSTRETRASTAPPPATPLLTEVLVGRASTCHLVVVGGGGGGTNAEITPVLRSLVGEYLPWVLVDPRPALKPAQHTLLQALKEGDASFSCRVFLIDLSNGLDESLAFELLESIHLYLWPYATVVIYGKDEDMNDAIRSHALRNTVHALYLVTEGLDGSGRRREGVRGDSALIKPGGNRWVKCFMRCLYCEGGGVGARLVDRWNPDNGFLLGSPLFQAPPTDFHGHQFSIVTLDWYPFMDFLRDSDEAGTTVTPQDSLDVRMLTTLARTLNFTYEMRVPWDDQWGTSTPSGNWTGVVGTLQHHKADFSLLLSWLRGRYQVVEYSRIYVNEPIVMIMLKPGPLPQYLALIRPLSGEVWAALFLSTVSAGLILWALQWAWGRACGRKGLNLDTSILYTWSILFEEPPPHIPTNMSGRMFVGWWWLYCTLFTVVYRSSLIAHLSVPGTSTAIDSFEQLLDEGGWTWGYEPSYGAGWEWFKTNTNPIIKRIYQGMEVLEFPEQMERVLRGRHALITWKYKIKSLVAALYTDEYGNTPIYTARQVYFNYGGYGWCFRKGAPFRRAIDLQKQRMIEAGLIPQWIDDLVGTKAMKARDQFGKTTSLAKDWAKDLQENTEGERVVLSLLHLQSVFLLLVLGFSISAGGLFTEMVVHAFVTRTENKEQEAIQDVKYQ